MTLLGIGQISLDGEGVVELCGDTVHTLPIDVADDHSRTFGGGRFRNRPADSTGGAGHERGASGEVHVRSGEGGASGRDRLASSFDRATYAASRCSMSSGSRSGAMEK